jgi:hypothetical protein
MEESSLDTSARTPDLILRALLASRLSPVWIGLGLAIAWLLFAGLVHVIADTLMGTADLPFGPALYAWNLVLNAVLLGLILAGHAHLHQGAISDLEQLRPVLSASSAEFDGLIRDVPTLSAPLRWGVTFLGMAGGFAVATLDPTLRDLYRDVSSSDPRYIVFVVQNVLFGALATRLFSTEVHMTRAYARLGERVAVDLLDLSPLMVFARKGLRSVLIWVLISSAFSMFWLLDSAGQANALLPFAVLALVLAALIAPTLGVHRSIAATKASELTRIARAIQTERDLALAPRREDAPPEDARLGNLIQYHAFVRSLREWPFDLSIVARSALLVALGAGSWLGGAIVERLLGAVLD